MSQYYKYLERYTPSFLRQYQTGHYNNLQRSTQYAQIVQMNATTSLTVDEDLTLKLRAPFTIMNILGFLGVCYWFFFHIDVYSTNSLRNRLRSYHNYKLWSRLEWMVRKHSKPEGIRVLQQKKRDWLKELNVSEEKYAELEQLVKDGADPQEVLKNSGVEWNLALYPYIKL